MSNVRLLKIILVGFVNKHFYKKYGIKVDVFIKQFNLNPRERLLGVSPSVSTPYVIADGIKEETANEVLNYLQLFGCVIKIEESTLEEISGQEELIQNWISNSNKPLRCPHCGSTAITTGQRGFSIVTGFLGSNNTVNRCGKCGYSWKP